MSVDPQLLAEEAGLRYVVADTLGIQRRRRGRGFTYIDSNGKGVTGVRRDRIQALAIPPAWTDVRIATTADCHILATGLDEAGRRQYRYHEDFRRVADTVKFARVAVLGSKIAELRSAVDAAIASDDERERLTGLIVRVLDVSLMRVGSERYADDNDSYGASTLRREHVTAVGDRVEICFVGKGGKEHAIVLDDHDLARFVKAQAKRRSGLRSSPVFCASDGWSVDGEAVKSWLHDAIGVDATAKDLRTWGASAEMVRACCDEHDVGDGADLDERLLAAFDRVAERLGNTRVMAREAYVAPAIVEAFVSGRLDECWDTSRGSARRSRQESALDKLLRTPATS